MLESESEVAQSCPTLCDPMDCSLLGSSVHGIFQARVLEWVAIASSALPTELYPIKRRYMYTWHPTPVLLPGKSHRQRSLVSYSPWGLEELDTTERLHFQFFTFHFHALEKEMATLSSVLAWRIPGMVEPGGLLCMGSHRVRHD